MRSKFPLFISCALLTATAAARPLRASERGSGYLNLGVFQATTRSANPALDGNEPFQARAEFVQNLGAATFEAAAYFKDREPNAWERGDTALTLDWAERQTRVRLGDSVPLTAGYLTALPSGGAHVFRQFNIDPSRPAAGPRSAVIQVKSPSLLEVSVNQVPLARLRVPAGPFDLRGLPLLTGRNRVHARLTDDFGATEDFDVDLFFDGARLGADLHEFSYLLGVPSATVGHDRAYITGPLTSILHRYGWSDTLTVGVNGQSFEGQTLFGAEALYVTAPGTWQTDVARSEQQRGPANAARLRFRSAEQLDGLLRRWRISAEGELRDRDFGQVGLSFAPPQEVRLRSETLAQVQAADRVVLGAGGGYQWAHLGFEDARVYRALAQWAPDAQWRIDVSGSRFVRETNEDQWLVTVTWSEFAGPWSVSAAADTRARQNTVAAHRSLTLEGHDVAVDARVGRGDSAGDSAEGRVTYAGPLAEAQAEHRTSVINGTTTDRSQAAASSALVWSGGRFALSRPVREAFALVETDESTRVHPDLNSYETVALPAGDDAVDVRPGYRGGVFVDARPSTVRGRLKAAEPLAYVSGEISDTDGVPVRDDFFTDARGTFVLDNLPPGRYRLMLNAPGWKPLEWTVPEGFDTDVGELVMEAAP